jgi:hypothetical protein
MPVSDCWDINYTLKRISHIDGVLSYDGNTGTAPAAGDWVIGGTTGVVGKILTGSDLGGTNATGTLTLTETTGRFQDNETLRVLSSVNFDTVANGGFKVGDTITGPTTESIDVKAIEYNWDASLPGEGYIWGNNLTSGFANNEQLDVSGGATAVALVHTAAETDNSALFATCLVNGEMAVAEATNNTNQSVIIGFDAGSAAIVAPERCRVSDATTGAFGTAQQVLGDTTEGTYRLVDYDSQAGAFSDGNTLQLEDVVNYDAQVAGQVFNVGDVVVGATSGATGRVLAVIDDGDSTGRLVLGNKSGTFDALTPDDLQVGGTKVAEVENTTFTLTIGTINLPNGIRTEQLSEYGGMLERTESLNIVRDVSQLYSYAQDTFDELAQLDDDPPFLGVFKDNVYTLQNNWFMPLGSFRFLEKGSIQSAAGDLVVRGFDSIFTGKDIAANGYFQDAGNPTPMPHAYVVQNGAKVAPWFLEGPFRVMLPIKTRNLPEYIDGTVPALGQLIDGGKVEWFSRPYLRQYAVFEDTQTAAGVSPVVLANPDDINNNTGQYTADWDGGSAATLTVGEEIYGVAGTAPNEVEYRGVVTAQTGDAGATGTVTYVLKSSAQLANNAVLTGQVSGKSITINEPTAPDSVVAGYGTDVRVMTVDVRFTGGTTTGTFVIGETVTQTGTGATGFVLEDDGGVIYVQRDTGTFNNSGTLTGGASGATNTPTLVGAFTTVPKDIGDGLDNNYTAVISGNITGGSASSIQQVYEWTKYVNRREEETLLQGGPGNATGVIGAIYRTLDTTFLEVTTAPYGTKPGSLMFGAQGVFIDKDTLIAADLQNIQLIDNAGTSENPPNLQSLVISNLTSGVRTAAYRSTGSGSTTILRTEFDVGTVGGGNNQAADNTILVGANTRSVSPLPNDVPDTGHLYVLDPNDTGIYLRFEYSSVNRTTNVFTLASGTIGTVTGGTDLTANDNVHVAFIVAQSAGSTVSNTMQYVSDIDIFYVARVKGKVPFEGTGVFGATGATLPATLNEDTVVELP